MQVGPGVIVGGKYQMERPLARGGMGAVWVARHVKLGSSVAIKLLDAHLAESSQSVARFEREARSAANLDTPHVVHVHDYGVEAGTPYLVMELLRGEDLNTRLRRRRRLTLQEAAKIVTQMGRALRRAHEAGIIHRDLKPANVFLARVDDDEIVKILDFGIAKETWSRVEESTKTGEVFGSPHYMSPEQARAQKDVDHRADLWATGVIAYRLITGKLPFPGEVLGEVLSSVLVDPFPPIAEVAPELPAGLEGFFAKALAKKKEQRFANVAELVEAFNAIVAAAPPQVLPPEDDPSTGPTLDPVRSSAAPQAPSQIGIQAVAPRDHGAAGATTAMLAQGKPPGPPGAIADTASLTVPLAKPALTFDPAPLAPSDMPSSPSGTGPSLASSSSSLLPPGLRPRRAPVVWIAGAAAVCVVLVVILAVVGQGSSDGQAAAGAESTTATATNRALDPKSDSPPSVSPAGPAGSDTPLLGAPSPSASASAASASTASPTKSPSPARTAPTSTTAPRSSATPGATTGGTPGKKPRDWGL